MDLYLSHHFLTQNAALNIVNFITRAFIALQFYLLLEVEFKCIPLEL